MELRTTISLALEKKWLRVAIIIVTAVVMLAGVFGAADAAFYANKIHRGVQINGISLAGKTKAQAADEIKKLVAELEAKPVTIEHKGKSWKVAPGELKAKIDRDMTVERAFAVGRSGVLATDVAVRARLWFKRKSMAPAVSYDREALDALVRKVAEAVDVDPEDAEVKVVEGHVLVTNSKNGMKVVRPRLSESIVKALASTNARSASVPVTVVWPDIGEEDLESTKNVVKQMLKAPVNVTYEDESWTITKKHIIEWLRFKKEKEGARRVLKPELDSTKVAEYLDDITAKITIEPQDARFEVTVDTDTVTVLPSKTGRKVDVKKAIAGILEASQRRTERAVALEMREAKPGLTTEEALKMGIKEKVSSFTTHYNAGQRARVHNIHTLARELDGTILAPGEVFSFNGNIGPRTASKGYEEAPAIINGELVPSLGGGVCQVATTLFNSIFFGGYEVVERHNHSLYISHYPTGRDATVSYGGPDLKFKNDSEYYVLIKAWTTQSTITISFFSTDRGLKVAYSTAGPSNFRGYPTKKEPDPSLPAGTTKVTDKGAPGSDVTVYRTVTKDGKVVKKDKFFSRYKPKTAVVRVGTKQPEPVAPQPGGQAPAGTPAMSGQAKPQPVPQP